VRQRTVAYDGTPVDQDVTHTGRISVRIVVRRLVGDARCVEDRNVSESTLHKTPAVGETKVVGRQAGHASYRLLEPEQTLLA
jgi:hypothetical protein